jgi:CRP-like cAMP-binding protein
MDIRGNSNVQTLERRRTAVDVRSETIARRLGSLIALTPGETDFLHRVGAGPVSVWAARSLLELPTDEQLGPRYVISGWAARVRELQDGRRQLVQLILPGDVLAPQLQIHDQLQLVQCVTMVQAVDGTAVRLAARDPARFPGIAAATELAAAQDRALMMEQVTRLGRQTAYERMANLFFELHYRCKAVGLVHGDSFPFPLTQESLGDLLGLSVVHVNRTLQLMRREGVIQLRQGRLTMLNQAALAIAAEFRAPKLAHLP